MAATAAPVAIGNPLYAEPWRSSNIPQSMVDAAPRNINVGTGYAQPAAYRV